MKYFFKLSFGIFIILMFSLNSIFSLSCVPSAPIIAHISNIEFVDYGINLNFDINNVYTYNEGIITSKNNLNDSLPDIVSLDDYTTLINKFKINDHNSNFSFMKQSKKDLEHYYFEDYYKSIHLN